MDPRGLRAWSYPVMLYAGMVCGVIAQNYAAHVARLPAVKVWAATLVLLPTALLGARLLYAASHFRIYVREPQRLWHRAAGGMALYGAVPLMLLCSLPTLRWMGVTFWPFWDVSVFCILVGMIFTRVGCLLNGCCAGRPTEGLLGIQLRDHNGTTARRIPTQILEAAWAFVLLIAGALWWRRTTPAGALFLLTLAAYAAGRFALQPWRAYRQRAWRVDLQQAISALFAASAISGFLLMRR
jgi:prolipoprotein diacylglyceryltransferase